MTAATMGYEKVTKMVLQLVEVMVELMDLQTGNAKAVKKERTQEYLQVSSWVGKKADMWAVALVVQLVEMKVCVRVVLMAEKMGDLLVVWKVGLSVKWKVEASDVQMDYVLVELLVAQLVVVLVSTLVDEWAQEVAAVKAVMMVAQMDV